jgi:ubiquinone/menaquinone biosynthesis C-methylase UbiE
MDERTSNLHFQLMSLSYRFRDLFLPRRRVLEEAGIELGFQVLDYGCGPGSYVPALAELVGECGRVYAVDIHPRAIQRVQAIVAERHLNNVETVLSDCQTGLPDGRVDVVLLYDTFHDLKHPKQVLQELHRVLKPEGVLSFSDHHMEEREILTQLQDTRLFSLLARGRRTYRFLRLRTD